MLATNIFARFWSKQTFLFRFFLTHHHVHFKVPASIGFYRSLSLLNGNLRGHFYSGERGHYYFALTTMGAKFEPGLKFGYNAMPCIGA
jgi:hypothetical protein